MCGNKQTKGGVRVNKNKMICGTDNGVPKRVDRLKCLGNAVVPLQAAEAWRKLTENLSNPASLRGGGYKGNPRSGLKAMIEGQEKQIWPTPNCADAFTDKLKSSQQRGGSKHSVTLAQAAQRNQYDGKKD